MPLTRFGVVDPLEVVMSSLTMRTRLGEVQASLADTLWAMGIRLIPERLVLAHKQKVLAGRSKFLHSVGLLLMSLSLSRILDHAAGVLVSNRTVPIATLWIGFYLGCAGLGLFLLLGTGVSPALGLLPFVPVTALASLLFLLSNDAFGCWVRTPLRSYHELPLWLQRRAEIAESIPGVRLELDSFEEDPFLIAVRGHFWWKEEAVIGAFATGDPILDDF